MEESRSLQEVLVDYMLEGSPTSKEQHAIGVMLNMLEMEE